MRIEEGRMGGGGGDMELVLHPRSEIEGRTKKLQSRMEGLTGAIIFQAVDMLYLSGTAQEGLVYIPSDPEEESVVMVRKSLDRARADRPLRSSVRSLKNMKSGLSIPMGGDDRLELDLLPPSKTTLGWERPSKTPISSSYPIRSERSVRQVEV
jgi:hypothetical protein